MKVLSITVLGACLAPASFAQDPQYPDFSSIAGLELVERAAQLGNTLRVHDETAPTGGGNRGAVWYQTPLQVTSGFDTSFTFNINQGGVQSGGGDGMALVIQNEQIAGSSGGVGVMGIGRHASANGYGLFAGSPAGDSVENSLAIEIDTYGNGNSPILDPDGNHISIHTGGTGDNSQDEAYSIGRASSMALGTNLSDGLPHTVRVVYVPGTLEVYLDGALAITAPYSFATGGVWIDSGMPVGGLSLMGGTSAWVGFTASSGGVVENHDLLAWTWDSGSLGTNYCTAAPNSSGSAGTMSAVGSLSAAANDFTLMASNLPPNQFGIFLTSRTQGFAPGAGGTSNGNLCLGGSIGRFTLPSQIVNAGSTGTFSLTIPLNAIPQGAANVSVAAGETWNFQSWHRDGVGLGSNFSDGLEVVFQ